MSFNPRTPVRRPSSLLALGDHHARLRAIEREWPQYFDPFGTVDAHGDPALDQDVPLGYNPGVGTVPGALTGGNADPDFSLAVACAVKQVVTAQVQYKKDFGSGVGTGTRYLLRVNPAYPILDGGFTALNAPPLGCGYAQYLGGGLSPEHGTVIPIWLRQSNNTPPAPDVNQYLEGVLSDGTIWGPTNPHAWVDGDMMLSITFSYFTDGPAGAPLGA